MEINIREFTRNIYKYLVDGGEYVVTRHGKPWVAVKVRKCDGLSYNIEGIFEANIGKSAGFKPQTLNPLKKNNKVTLEQILSAGPVGNHACGCVKTDKILCPKHMRH